VVSGGPGGAQSARSAARLTRRPLRGPEAMSRPLTIQPYTVCGETPTACAASRMVTRSSGTAWGTMCPPSAVPPITSPLLRLPTGLRGAVPAHLLHILFVHLCPGAVSTALSLAFKDG